MPYRPQTPEEESDLQRLYDPDEFDLAIERITAANPEKVAKMIVYADEQLTSGRAKPMDSF